MSEITMKKHNEEIPLIVEGEIPAKGVETTLSIGTARSRFIRRPKIGTCCSISLACVGDSPGTKCILHECAKSKGFISCLECLHWSNLEDPCPLHRVSRDYCPAMVRLFDRTL